MNWEVVARPQVVADILEAAEWYNTQRVGLGDEFTEEILTVFDALAIIRSYTVLLNFLFVSDPRYQC